jgi:hypothetical protein
MIVSREGPQKDEAILFAFRVLLPFLHVYVFLLEYFLPTETVTVSVVTLSLVHVTGL